MQTFEDSKLLAKEKDVNNLFGQSSTFKLSGEAEAGSAGEQPVRISQTDGNEKAAAQSTAAFPNNHFYPHA